MKSYPKGFSLHLGVNRLSSTSSTYAVPVQRIGNAPLPGIKDLKACENDAKAFAHLAVSNHFRKVSLLLSEYARKDNLMGILDAYARELRAGDLFLLTFSGHGGQIKDHSGDEKDGLDEVWCLYDTIVTDDELYDHWKKFDKGVRIAVVSDSCHSGDILKSGKGELGELNSRQDEVKRMFQNSCDLVNTSIEASIQVLAACRSHQITREMFSNNEKWHGVFSNCILNSHSRDGSMSYSELFTSVEKCVSSQQQPHRQFIGLPNEEFYHGPAFKIEG